MTAMTAWSPEFLLNARQVAYLLGRNPRNFPSDWPAIPEMPEPVAQNPDRWTPDQIREVIAALPGGTSKENVNLEDTELLRNKQIAALHNPPIKETTVDSYNRRTRNRQAEGKGVANPYPEKVKDLLGHPLWHPRDIGVYLRGRTGSGWHAGLDEDRRYRGGRGGWGKNRQPESVPS